MKKNQFLGNSISLVFVLLLFWGLGVSGQLPPPSCQPECTLSTLPCKSTICLPGRVCKDSGTGACCCPTPTPCTYCGDPTFPIGMKRCSGPNSYVTCFTGPNNICDTANINCPAGYVCTGGLNNAQCQTPTPTPCTYCGDPTFPVYTMRCSGPNSYVKCFIDSNKACVTATIDCPAGYVCTGGLNNAQCVISSSSSSSSSSGGFIPPTPFPTPDPTQPCYYCGSPANIIGTTYCSGQHQYAKCEQDSNNPRICNFNNYNCPQGQYCSKSLNKCTVPPICGNDIIEIDENCEPFLLKYTWSNGRVSSCPEKQFCGPACVCEPIEIPCDSIPSATGGQACSEPDGFCRTDEGFPGKCGDFLNQCFCLPTF